MQIAGYAEQYRDDVIALVNNFYDEALHEYSAPISQSVLLETIEKFKDNAFLMVVDGKCQGLMAGFVTKSPLNDDKVYQEFIWYVNKSNRLKGVIFLRRVEEALKESGFKQLIMACMANSKMDAISTFYERIGFILLEKQYLKNL